MNKINESGIDSASLCIGVTLLSLFVSSVIILTLPMWNPSFAYDLLGYRPEPSRESHLTAAEFADMGQGIIILLQLLPYIFLLTGLVAVFLTVICVLVR